MVGIFTSFLVGDFEPYLISYLIYNFITVVSTILLNHMYGRRFFFFFFPRFNIGRSMNTEYYELSYMLPLTQDSFENKSRVLPHPQKYVDQTIDYIQIIYLLTLIATL